MAAKCTRHDSNWRNTESQQEHLQSNLACCFFSYSSDLHSRGFWFISPTPESQSEHKWRVVYIPVMYIIHTTWFHNVSPLVLCMSYVYAICGDLAKRFSFLAYPWNGEVARRSWRCPWAHLETSSWFHPEPQGRPSGSQLRQWLSPMAEIQWVDD